jgi:branched-chain amino acid transport system substrate-binding protein
MTSLNRVRYAVCILALALAAVFPLRATAADPYVFPVILSLTGGGGFLGQGEATTLRTMEAMVNKAGGIRGRPIKFDIADDTSNPQVTVQLVDQLIARNVPLILGATLTGTCGAEMPRVKEGGPVVMCLSPGVYPPPGSYMFTSNAWTVDEIHADIRYFRLRGMTKIGMITSTDGSGAAAEKGLNETFALPENRNLQVVAREHFNPTDISVSAQLERIRAAKPDYIIVWSTGTPAGTVFRGIAESGLNLPVLTTGGNLTYVQMKQYAEFTPKNLYFAGQPEFAPDQVRDRRVQGAVRRFLGNMATANIAADYGPVAVWDPVLMFVDILRKIGPDATSAQIHNELSNLKGWVGASGVYDFTAYPQRGVGENGVVIVRWDVSKGTWVGVSDPGGIPFGKR